MIEPTLALFYYHEPATVIGGREPVSLEDRGKQLNYLSASSVNLIRPRRRCLTLVLPVVTGGTEPTPLMRTVCSATLDA